MGKRKKLEFQLPSVETVRKNYSTMIGQIELLNQEIEKLEEEQSDILTQASLSPIYDSDVFDTYADNKSRITDLLFQRDKLRSEKSSLLIYEHLDSLYNIHDRVIEIEEDAFIHRFDLDHSSELSKGELIALRTIAEQEAYNYDEDMESLDVYGLYKITVRDRMVTMIPIKLKTEIIEEL